MNQNFDLSSPGHENYEISPRFRKTMEDRIERLERDAVEDERILAVLDHPDHIRRHLRLVAVQRAEALRMRLFLGQVRHTLAATSHCALRCRKSLIKTLFAYQVR